jgi:hypothetical protein
MSKYYRPVFATIRLEAIWTLRIGHLRGAGKVIKHVLKEVDTIIKQRYEPNRGACFWLLASAHLPFPLNKP